MNSLPGLTKLSGIAIILACTLMCCSGCFWRNCPAGGKRGIQSASPTSQSRPCTACGPKGNGQCVGPDICCTPTSGCHIGTEYSQVCSRENEIMTPCAVKGKPCGDRGNCVSDGVCCNLDSCKLEAKCNIDKKKFDAEFLTFLETLLQGEHQKGLRQRKR